MPLEEPPNRAAAADDPAFAHHRNDFIQRQIRLLGNQPQQNGRVRLQRRDAASARLGRNASGFRLVQTEKLASLGQLTAGIAHEIKNPLNFVNNFSAVSVVLIDELREALGGAHLDSKMRAEISEIADTLQGNLDKVVQHGKRADAIVKNMLFILVRGQESTGRSISMPWSMRALISPITARGRETRLQYHPGAVL